MKLSRLFFVLIFFLIVQLLFPHSGRTDRYGGHNNRKTGGYHYHNAGYVHAAGNPYQDHTRCGICKSSKQRASKISQNSAEKNLDKSDIRSIQSALKTLGYYSDTIDGIIGSNTRSAIKKFQKDYQIISTGVLNKETIEKIKSVGKVK